MVTASKRFTIHRSPNVLTLSLKRFANFTGGKITKVLSHIHTITLSSCTSPFVFDKCCFVFTRMLNIQKTWTCGPSCLSVKEKPRSMGCMLFWSTLGSAAMLDTTSAILRCWPCYKSPLIHQDVATEETHTHLS